MKCLRIAAAAGRKEEKTGFSKFWGFPLMPESFDYPTYRDEDGEEGQYDFVCQIDCADIAQYDSENLLPHSGMLYFFGRIGAYAGNFWEEGLPKGFWKENGVKVIYTPRTDFENFVEMALEDEDGNEICYPERKAEVFLPEGNSAAVSCDEGHLLLCADAAQKAGIDVREYIPLFQLGACQISKDVNLEFPDQGSLFFLVPTVDLTGKKRTFKHAIGFLSGR